MAEVPKWARLRQSENPDIECGTCGYFEAGRCTLFDFAKVDESQVCDEWEGDNIFSAAPNNRGKTIEENLLESPSPVIRKGFDPIIVGKAAMIRTIPEDAKQELIRFWTARPDLREGCTAKYGHDPVEDAANYWENGIAEPEHANILAKIRANGGVFTLGLVKMWEREELKEASVEKAQAYPHELILRVHGMSKTTTGIVYRLATKDGRYVGQTIPTKVRARKGDSVKVRASHLGKDSQGDVYWINPVVAGQTPDAPHSWRQLEALAGGQLYQGNKAVGPEFDQPASTQDYSAPGPGGRIPYPGDDMNLSDAVLGKDGEGPTSSSVHVDAPLPNISISYATQGKKLKRIKPQSVDDEPVVEPMLVVHKADPMKQIVYGVVLEPHVLDTQSDYMLPQHVEKAAHTYLKKIVRGKASVSKFQHRKPALFKTKPSVVPVESFIAPQDFTYDGSNDVVKKGSWVLAVHVEDPATWQDVLDGKWAGFSVGGMGVRQSLDPETLLEGRQWMASQPSSWSPQPFYTG